MESRRSYGWGMTGSDKKGFEWELEDEYGKVQSGYVYKTCLLYTSDAADEL